MFINNFNVCLQDEMVARPAIYSDRLEALHLPLDEMLVHLRVTSPLCSIKCAGTINTRGWGEVARGNCLAQEHNPDLSIRTPTY